MRIAIFGATGRVGQEVVRLALAEGYKISALVRDESKAEELIPGADFIYGDATNPQDIKKTLSGADLVFSGLSTDKTDTLTKAVPEIIQGMNEAQINRIVTIGTAGILDSRYEPGKYRFQTSESKRKKTFAAEEHAKVYEQFLKSSLNWTIVCPTYLPDGDAVGEVRAEADLLPKDGKKVTVGDTALFAFHELLQNQYVHHRVGICY
ncbi:NAD(P)-dependent oxidoreductase [Halobacillus halophilus]|uniref:NAD(P)-dependent oxidoreductase n=1 Tax=Halobacillus halophilus TaxID=1570 RepID=UPI001CD31096|nr:NAD(P)H-binding protein [Halobacillus halophilus]MCA1012123.1 NAD(P)H-binding protein [Halobacillus halophilus]